MQKKKGSSIVLVLLLAAAIMMVGTVSITSVSMNVKMRVEENKRVQSLYGADAGLEYANNLVVKTYDSATQYAEQVVQQEIQQLLETTGEKSLDGQLDDESTNQKFDKKMNEIFKKAFIEFINVKITDGAEVKESNEFVESIKTGSYINLETDDYDKQRVYVEFNSNSEKKPKLNAQIIENVRYKNEAPFELTTNHYEFTVLSEFESVEQGINNTREVEVTYQIEIPDYRGLYTSQTIDIFKVFNDKAMTIDKDLNIVNGVNATIDGKVFIVGQEPKSYDLLAYDKYQGGIKVDGAQVTFKDDAATSKTLNVLNSGNVAMDKNLYARNLYVGKLTGESTTGTVKIAQAAILDNDLALKANNSVVEINDFYGLNDKTYKGQVIADSDHKPSNDVNNPGQKVDRVSSSIIVNGNDTTTLKIKNSAYIMGVAYINTLGKQYQTGESVAIKGNYLAYTHSLPDSQKYANAEFNYYEPLQLVDSLNGKPLSVVEKSEYFNEFYSNSVNGIPSTGGVELPSSNIYTAGAVVYENNGQLFIEKSKYDANSDAEVTKKREDYATNVYEMGHTKRNKMELYHTLGLNGNQSTVISSIDWEKLKDNCTKVPCDTNEIKLIPTTGKTVVMGANANKYSGEEYVTFDLQTYDETSPEGPKLKAVIIIDGDVIIDGSIDFTGNIIATGNVTMTGSGKQSIKYKAATTNGIIASNYLAFKDIFTGDMINTQLVNQFENHESVQYTPDQYIKTTNWKITR